MKNQNRIYVYCALSIIAAIGAYFVINKPSKAISPDAAASPDDGQAIIPKELSSVLDLSKEQVVKVLGNKNVFTKVADVNARQKPFVNNGTVNNSWGKISTTGTLIGKVIAVADDSGAMKNPAGRVYKWFKVILSPEAIDSIIASGNTGMFDVKLKKGISYPAYVREDTVIFK